MTKNLIPDKIIPVGHEKNKNLLIQEVGRFIENLLEKGFKLSAAVLVAKNHIKAQGIEKCERTIYGYYKQYKCLRDEKK